MILVERPVCNSVSSAADRPYSYIIVTTKVVPELVKVSEVLAPLLSSAYTEKFLQPTYVLMQNGLNVEMELYNTLKTLGVAEPRIISTALWIGTNLLEGNVVEHNDFVCELFSYMKYDVEVITLVQDRVALGIYRHNDNATTINTPEQAVLLEDFAGMLEAGGSTVEVVGEIQRVKFRKNIWNVAFSSFATLTGYPLPAIFRPAPAKLPPKYSPYTSPTTAALVDAEVTTAFKATIRELLTLGNVAINLLSKQTS